MLYGKDKENFSRSFSRKSFAKIFDYLVPEILESLLHHHSSTLAVIMKVTSTISIACEAQRNVCA